MRHLRRTIRRLGVLQIDSVNVLERAHYVPLFSRLGPYEKSRLDDLVYGRREFIEQWAHEASIVPVESWPLLRHRMETFRVRPWGFEKFLEEHADWVDRVLEEVRSRGPLAADDLAAPAVESDRIEKVVAMRADDRMRAWLGTARRATLEAYFGRGVLTVTERRSNFSRVYDLAERVIPAELRRQRIGRQAAERALLRLAGRAQGVGAVADLADYYRMPVRAARRRIAELVEAGELREVRVEGWREPAYLDPGARLARRIDASALLSPFDPVVWTRSRVARLFDFDYRIEIFVPQAKRRWGYYVLPFLLGDRLVARVDLKADRKARRLLVLAAHIEPEAEPGGVAEALASELQTMALWLGLETVAVGRRGGFARLLGAAVRA